MRLADGNGDGIHMMTMMMTIILTMAAAKVLRANGELATNLNVTKAK